MQKLHVTPLLRKGRWDGTGKDQISAHLGEAAERDFSMLRFATLSARQGSGMSLQTPLNLLRAAWTAKVSRYSGMLQAAGTRFNLLPVPLSALGGWYPDAHRALCSVATTISARGLSTFSPSRSILFQCHAALLLTNNALLSHVRPVV